jgi:hypothetical protein
MAPTNWDYDRDFVYHSSAGSNAGNRSTDRNWGQRLENSARRGWDRLTQRSSRGSYDRDLGYRGGSTSQWGTSRNYDRDIGYRGGAYGAGGYMGSRGVRGYGADYSRDFNSIYDRGYKSRAETETGDPFNDRGARTPIRIMRGEYSKYGRDYSTNPISYEPNDFRTGSGYRTRDQVPPTPYDRDFRGLDRGYDRGWF